MANARHYLRWIHDEFRPYLGKTVAEVGAGTGNFSRMILKSNIDRLMAFEPSDNMFPILQKALEQDRRATAVHDYFNRIYDETAFDSVIYVNVLEHVEHDIVELSLALDALKTDGHILILVPALKWLYSDFDRLLGHFRRYHLNDLIALVNKVGFTVVRARYLDMPGIVPWYVYFRLFGRTMQKGNVIAYDRLAIPFIRIFEQVFPPVIGKNIILIGKKE
ncbi:methyltransferase domain-containing protein [bacterium]|nr:methyltransferase domain-containing protein [bacterium]